MAEEIVFENERICFGLVHTAYRCIAHIDTSPTHVLNFIRISKLQKKLAAAI